MSAISVTIYEIFANQMKCKKFDLENECQGQRGEKLDLRHSIENVRLVFFFIEFLLPSNIRLCKEVTHT